MTGQPLPLALFLGGPQDLSNHKWKLTFLKPDTFYSSRHFPLEEKF